MRLEDGRVAMPLEYWISVTRYIVDVAAVQEILEGAP